MFIIPLAKTVSKKQFPYVTTALIIINCLVYLFFQIYDDFNRQEAMQFYYESGLAEYESENYINYLKATELPEEKLAELEQSLSNENSNEFHHAVFRASIDQGYHQHLIENGVYQDFTDEYMTWKANKREFYSLLERDWSYSHGLFSNELSITRLLSYQFLHGSWDHLFFNMLFLGAVGITIELTIGSSIFLLFYLLSGVASGLLHSVFTPHELVPLVGASGSISGVMGMYAFVFRLTKIRVFYSLLFYFGYAKIRALYVFPMWIGYEIYNYLTDDMSNVAYMAHAGGLLAGAALSLLWYLATKNSNVEVQQEIKSANEGTTSENTEAIKFAEVKNEIISLNFKGADFKLTNLAKEFPDSFNIVYQLYLVRKIYPKTPEFTESLQRVLAWHSVSDTVIKKQINAFRESVIVGGAKPKMDLRTILHLSALFIKFKHIEFAEYLLNLLIKKNVIHKRLPPVLEELALAYKNIGNQEKQLYWQGVFNNVKQQLATKS